MVPQLGPLLRDLLLLCVRSSFELDTVTAAQQVTLRLPSARSTTVAFADLTTGFTRLGERLSPEELERVASRLAGLAHEVAIPPVRFVKSTGYAAMLVSPGADTLLNALIDLRDTARAEGLPRLKIGVASGQAVTRAGDWFGNPVNLASHVTALARPGALLVTASTRNAITDESITWSAVGPRRLKGVKRR